MIGNDIVDLEDPETAVTASHPRFDARVFSPGERDRIAKSKDPARERWIFWAAKEAAYKMLRAADTGVVFSPVKFEVTRTGESRAQVERSGEILVVDLDVRPAVVHAVAHSPGRTRRLSALGKCHGADPSGSARALTVESLAPLVGAAPGELRVDRAPGAPPVLVFKDQPTNSTLSLSHHGRFVAFACELPPGAGWGS